MRHQAIRMLSLFMTMLMLLTSVDLQVLAAELPEADLAEEVVVEPEEVPEEVVNTPVDLGEVLPVAEPVAQPETPVVEKMVEASAVDNPKVTINGEEYTKDPEKGAVIYDRAMVYGESVSISLTPEDFCSHNHARHSVVWRHNGIDIASGSSIEINAYYYYIEASISYIDEYDCETAEEFLTVVFEKNKFCNWDVNGVTPYSEESTAVTLRPVVGQENYVLNMNAQCILEGDSVTKYEWKQDGSETVISNEASYTIPHIEENMPFYYCDMTNSRGFVQTICVFIEASKAGIIKDNNYNAKAIEKVYYAEASEGQKYDGSSGYKVKPHGAGYPVLLAVSVKQSDLEGFAANESLEIESVIYTIKKGDTTIAENVEVTNDRLTARACNYSEYDDGKLFKLGANIGFFDFEEGATYSVTAKLMVRTIDYIHPNNHPTIYSMDIINGKFVCQPKDDQGSMGNQNNQFLNAEAESEEVYIEGVRKNVDSRIDKIEIKGTVGEEYKTILTGNVTSKNDDGTYQEGDRRYPYENEFLDAKDLLEKNGYRVTAFAKYNDLSPLGVFATGTKLDHVITFTDGSTFVAKNAITVLAKGAKFASGTFMARSLYSKSFDSTGNYVSVMIYGSNLDNTSVPAFYKNEDFSEGSKVAVFDSSDSNCGVTLDNGLWFATLKKVDPSADFWKDYLSTKLYVKYADDVITSEWASGLYYYYQPVYEIIYNDTGVTFQFGKGTTPEAKYKITATYWDGKESKKATQTLSVSDKKIFAGTASGLYKAMQKAGAGSTVAYVFESLTGGQTFVAEANPEWKKGNTIGLWIPDGRYSIYCNDSNPAMNQTAIVVIPDGTDAFKKTAPTFASSNTFVATVKADPADKFKCIVTGISPGETVITVKIGSVSQTIPIYVSKNTPVTGVRFKTKELELFTDWDNERTLYYSILPLDANYDYEGVQVSYDTVNKDGQPTDGVVTVEKDQYNNGVVRAVSGGEIYVRLSVTVPGCKKTFQDTCKVTVMNTYSDEESEEIDRAIGDLHYIMVGADSKLSNIELPSISGGKWEWKEPDTKLVADSKVPMQYFDAVYKKAFYPDREAQIPVAVSEVTGLKLELDKTKISGGTGVSADAHVSISFKGYAPNEWEFMDGNYAGITEASMLSAIKLNGEGLSFTNDVPFYFTITGNAVDKDTDRSVYASCTIGGKEFKSAAKKIKVTSKEFVTKIQLKDANGNIYDDEAAFTKDYNNEEVSLDVNARVAFRPYGGDAVEAGFTADTDKFFGEYKGKLQWTSSDSSVLEVKAAADTKSAKVTVKKAGIAVLTVKAKDAGAYAEEIVFDVRDYSPVLDSNKISIKRYGKYDLGLSSSYGNKITGVTPDSAAQAYIETSVDEDGNCFVQYKTSAEYKSTVAAKLTVATVDGKSKEFDVTFKVSNNTPSIKAKQTTKGNVFYKDAKSNSVVVLSASKAEITGVRLAENVDTIYDLIANSDNPSEVTFALKDGVHKVENLTTLKKSQTLPIVVTYKVEGVSDSKTVNITVKPTYKAPTLKANEARVIGNNSGAYVSVTNSTEKANLDLSQYTVTIADTKPAVDMGGFDGNGNIWISIKDSKKKSANYTLAISSGNWLSSVKAKGKLSKAASQELVLEKTKVTVNAKHDFASYESVAIPMHLKNSNAVINQQRTEFVAADIKAAKAFAAGYIEFGVGQYRETKKDCINVNIGANENDKFKDFVNGTYKFKVSVTDVYGYKTKPVTLTIVSTTKAANVSLKSSGKIDLSKRKTSFVTVSGNITGETDKIVGMYLDSKLFYGEYDNATGKMKVYAGEGAPIKAGVAYTVPVTVDTELGDTYTKNITIKPSYSKPKLKASVSTLTLYRSATGSRKSISCWIDNDVVYYLGFADNSFVDKYISDVGYSPDGRISFTLNERAKSLKKGTYTVTLYAEAGATPINMPKPTVKVKIVIK